MRTKKLFSVLAAAALSAMPLIGCGGDPVNPATPENTDPYNIPQDYCRTYYEVFVRSFSDGNGDGIGDIKGLINNLDYLNDGDDSTTSDLGINGIWMMPINSSPSYHKYDVEDYCNIDDEYGTLEDFDKLVDECNKRDIWLQMDLVLNHTSITHPWFKQALNDARNGKSPSESKYMRMYNFYLKDDRPSTGTFYDVSRSEYCYLGNFSSSMPDLNLANEDVRAEIEDIVDFWLNRGIRSFRLDAVPWAFADDTVYTEENGEFWSWFNDYCNTKGAEVYGKENDGINSYCYNVGEVFTSTSSTVNEFFGTGMSNFNFTLAGNDNMSFVGVAKNSTRALRLASYVQSLQADALVKDSDALLSNFLSNHDTNRSAGYMNYNVTQIKKAAGLYLLMPGNPYIYYGEELGALGSGKDENKRLAFNWGDKSKGLASDPADADYEFAQKLGTWKTQNSDPDSILTYYRNVIKLRNRFPEIGRGVMKTYALNAQSKLTALDNFDTEEIDMTEVNALNKAVAAYTLTWKDSSVLIVQNICNSAAEFDISMFAGYDIAGQVCATSNKSNAILQSGKLSIPAGTVAVLKTK